MSEKTKHVLSVAVFVAILLVMAAITFADGPGGWERLPILLMALLVLSAYGHTLHEWQREDQRQRRESEEEEREWEL